MPWIRRSLHRVLLVGVFLTLLLPKIRKTGCLAWPSCETEPVEVVETLLSKDEAHSREWYFYADRVGGERSSALVKGRSVALPH